MKKVLFVISIVMLHATSGFSQEEYCGFDESLKELFLLNPLQKAIVDSINQLVQNTTSHGNGITARSTITIPVVVHVVWHQPEENISDDRILGQINMLNLVFTNSHDDLALVPDEFKPVIGNPNLNFCLAAEDPFGNPSSGIIRVKTDFEKIASTDNLFFDETGGSTAWEPSRFLNIWITGPFGLKGFASFPGEGLPHKDGVILKYSVVGVDNSDNRQGNGRVAVHEIGHYLGLHHTWGNDLYAQDSLCQNDDGFSDTPLQWRYSYRCPSELYPAPFSCGSNDMYVNFMDYSPDECLSMFTHQQVEHMRTVIELYRPGLLNSSISCMSSVPPTDFNFTLYPNPTEYQLQIKMNPSTTLYEFVNVYDARGVKVWSEQMFLYDDVVLNIPQLPNGVYIVKIGNVIQRVVILTN